MADKVALYDYSFCGNFSFSIVLLVLKKWLFLGPITPIGGVGLILSCGYWAYLLIKSHGDSCSGDGVKEGNDVFQSLIPPAILNNCVNPFLSSSLRLKHCGGQSNNKSSMFYFCLMNQVMIYHS